MLYDHGATGLPAMQWVHIETERKFRPNDLSRLMWDEAVPLKVPKVPFYQFRSIK